MHNSKTIFTQVDNVLNNNCKGDIWIFVHLLKEVCMSTITFCLSIVLWSYYFNLCGLVGRCYLPNSMYCTPKEENAGDILLKKNKNKKTFIVIIFYDRFFNRTSFAWKLKKRPEITFILQCHFCHRTQLKKNQPITIRKSTVIKKKDSICVSRSSRSNQETVS